MSRFAPKIPHVFNVIHGEFTGVKNGLYAFYLGPRFTKPLHSVNSL